MNGMMNPGGHYLTLTVEDNQGIVGFMKSEVAASNASLVVRDEKTVSITGAYIKPGARRRGIGSLLLNAIVNWAAVSGYDRVSVDFESANISGSAFWMKHFTPGVLFCDSPC